MSETRVEKGMKSLLVVLRAAGPARVTRAMANVCKPNYENHGWRNCFFTQMFGGAKAIRRLKDKWGVISETDAVAYELGIEWHHVSNVIGLFDNDYEDSEGRTVGKMLSYTRKWLRDRLRRAGKPNPLLGAPAVA